MQMNRNVNWKIVGIASLIVALVCSVGYYSFYYTAGPITSYNPERDREDIIDSFERNRYWLSLTPGYSAEYMLDNRTPSQNQLHHGTLHIKVLRDGGTFAGFVAYYMKRADLGYILFLLVDQAFRGKRYGNDLVLHAINELKAMGAKDVSLITRVNNYPAQRIYDSIGFKKLFNDEEVFYYNYSLR